MTHNDLPDEGTGGEAMSFDEGIDSIADSLTDQDVDPGEDEAEQAEETESDDGDEDLEAAESDDEADEDDEDPEEDEEDAEDVDEDDDEEDEDSSAAPVDDDTVITLEDGTPITVGELKRNNLFQRDYTKKTSELAEHRKEVEQKEAKVSELEQSLAEMQDTLLGYYQAKVPQKPNPQDYIQDPLGYQEALINYNSHVEEWNAVYEGRQQTLQQQQQQAEQQKREHVQNEYNQLLQKLPEKYRGEKELETFFAREMGDASQHYGFTRDEISQAMVQDHRMILALRDANAYRRLKSKAPETKKQVKTKPKLVKSSRRPDPKAQASRKKSAKSAALRKTGDFDAGVQAIEELL